MRGIIEEKQRRLDMMPGNKEGRDGLMLIIKPANHALYEGIVDVLDETTISRVKKYELVKPTLKESTWLQLNE